MSSVKVQLHLEIWLLFTSKEKLWEFPEYCAAVLVEEHTAQEATIALKLSRRCIQHDHLNLPPGQT